MLTIFRGARAASPRCSAVLRGLPRACWAARLRTRRLCISFAYRWLPVTMRLQRSICGLCTLFGAVFVRVFHARVCCLKFRRASRQTKHKLKDTERKTTSQESYEPKSQVLVGQRCVRIRMCAALPVPRPLSSSHDIGPSPRERCMQSHHAHCKDRQTAGKSSRLIGTSHHGAGPRLTSSSP